MNVLFTKEASPLLLLVDFTAELGDHPAETWIHDITVWLTPAWVSLSVQTVAHNQHI